MTNIIWYHETAYIGIIYRNIKAGIKHQHLIRVDLIKWLILDHARRKGQGVNVNQIFQSTFL